MPLWLLPTSPALDGPLVPPAAASDPADALSVLAPSRSALLLHLLSVAMPPADEPGLLTPARMLAAPAAAAVLSKALGCLPLLSPKLLVLESLRLLGLAAAAAVLLAWSCQESNELETGGLPAGGPWCRCRCT